jgi:4-cresol dehydrogenase (hydroxylating)
MEVVLASGEIVRTGMGALPNSKSWQHNRWGYGPWVDGLFRQSNFGVVTKMGFYLMPRPEALQMSVATGMRDEDIVPMLDVINRLENEHLVNGSTQIFSGFVTGPDSPPPPTANAPAWTIQVPIYGPEKVVRAQTEYAKSRFTAIPGVNFVDGELIRTPLSQEAKARVRLVNFGIPNLSTFAMLGRAPYSPEPMGGHIGFSPIVPRTGESLLEFKHFYAENLSKVSGGENLGIVGPVYMTNWDRTLVCLIMFPIGRDKARNAKMRKAFEGWVKLAAERGWAEYRAPAAFQDLIANTYSYNNHALNRLRETIKDAVDPNGIISAGRYGVWPKHLRKA